MTNLRQDCGLYLVVETDREAITAPVVERVILDNDPACILLTASPGMAIDATLANQILHIAGALGVAVLIEDDAKLALELGADGLHIRSGEGTYAGARKAVGAELQIGIACGHSRHQAMTAAEQGADYVAFGNGVGGDPEDYQKTNQMLGWWSELFEIPCVAWRPYDMVQARNSAQQGADFVAVGSELWLHDKRWSEALIEPQKANAQSGKTRGG